MKLRKTLLGGALALTFAFTGLGAQATVAPVETASAAYQYSAICHVKTPGKTSSTTNWTGRNANTCKARYQVYDITQGRAKLILDINKKATDSTAFWRALSTGYNAAQKWCNTNSLTCSVLVSAGMAILAPIATAAKG